MSGGARTALIVGLAAGVAILGVGAWFGYGALTGSSADDTLPRVSDIADAPQQAWSLNLFEGLTNPTNLTGYGAGSNRGFFVAEYDVDGDGYGDLLDAAMVNMSNGEVIWVETGIDIDDEDYGPSWYVLDSDGGHVGLVINRFGSYEDKTSSETIIFDQRDGSRTSWTTTGYVESQFVDDLFLTTVQADTTTISVRRASDPNGTVLWEEETSNEGHGFCVAGDMLAVGSYTYDSRNGCLLYDEVEAFDLNSGEELRWSRRTSEDTVYHAYGDLLVQLERDDDRQRAKLSRRDMEGNLTWDSPYEFAYDDDNFASVHHVSESLILVRTSSGMQAINPATGEPKWNSGVSKLDNVLGIVGNSIIAVRGDDVVWIDSQSGQVTDSQRARFEAEYGYSVASSGKRLYLQDYTDVHALDAEGNHSWSHALGPDEYATHVGGHLVKINHEEGTVTALR